MNIKPIMTLLCGQSDTVHALDHVCDVARFASQPNSYWVRTSTDSEFSNYVVANCSIWDAAHRLGFEAFFPKEDGTEVTDDHLYVYNLRKIPCVDIINYDPKCDTGFGDFWHTHDDNMDIIIRDVFMLLGTKLNEPSTVLVVPRAIEKDDPFILSLAKAFGIKVRFISNKPGAINYEW